MPRIYKDIEGDILECSEQLFIQLGYNEVNMRDIAAKLNIAVGTIYNYYPDKQTLFVAVIKFSWDKTYTMLDEIMNSQHKPQQKLELYFKVLVMEIKRRNQLAINLFRQEILLNQEHSDYEKHNRLIDECFIPIDENLTKLLKLRQLSLGRTCSDGVLRACSRTMYTLAYSLSFRPLEIDMRPEQYIGRMIFAFLDSLCEQ